MTTIAWDGKTLCTDSLVCASGMKFGSAEKAIRLKDGSLLAVAGECWFIDALASHIQDGKEPPQLADDDRIEALLLTPDGDAFEYCKSESNEIKRHKACNPWTGGTGSTYAMSAMRLGKSAREAVELACDLDIHSGLPVMEHSLYG